MAHKGTKIVAATMMAALAVAGCSQSAETASSTASSSAKTSDKQSQEQILIMGAASTRVLNDAISAEFPAEFNNAGSSTSFPSWKMVPPETCSSPLTARQWIKLWRRAS